MGTRSVATIVESMAVRTTPIQMLPIITASLAFNGSSMDEPELAGLTSSIRPRPCDESARRGLCSTGCAGRDISEKYTSFLSGWMIDIGRMENAAHQDKM